MPYLLTQFDTVILPEYDPRVDVGTGRLQTVVLQLPGGGAFNVNQGGRSRRKVTPLSMAGTLIADTPAAMRTAYNLLRALTGYQKRLWRVWDDGTSEWCWAVMGEIGASRGRGSGLVQPVELTWTQISEAWLGTHHGVGWTFDSGIILDTGYVFDTTETTALDGSPKTVTATNAGNRDCESMRITVTAGSASITALKVANTAQNCEWQYTGTIAIGKALVMDTGAWTLLNDGVNAYGASFTLTANHKRDRWFRLAPGVNTLTVTYTGGGAGSTITLEYYDCQE